jgi:hypothetical protein
MATARRRGLGFLGLLVLLALIAVLVFFLLGGRVFFDADVDAPNVEVDPGELPDVNVEPADPADES